MTGNVIEIDGPKRAYFENLNVETGEFEMVKYKAFALIGPSYVGLEEIKDDFLKMLKKTLPNGGKIVWRVRPTVEQAADTGRFKIYFRLATVPDVDQKVWDHLPIREKAEGEMCQIGNHRWKSGIFDDTEWSAYGIKNEK